MAALDGRSCYFGLTLLAYGISEGVVLLHGADSAGTYSCSEMVSCYLGLTQLAHGCSERVFLLVWADSAGTYM